MPIFPLRSRLNAPLKIVALFRFCTMSLKGIALLWSCNKKVVNVFPMRRGGAFLRDQNEEIPFGQMALVRTLPYSYKFTCLSSCDESVYRLDFSSSYT